ARHDFYKSTERHNRLHFTFVDFSDFRFCYNLTDTSNRCIDRSFIIGKYLYSTFSVNFIDRNSSTGFALHFLDNFTAWSDNRTDEFFVDRETDNAGRMRLEIFTRSRKRLSHFTKDMQTSLSGLM